jgi:hypothetical protein
MRSILKNWLDALVVALLINILSLLLAAAAPDFGVLAGYVVFWSLFLWVAVGVLMIMWPTPGRFAKALVAMSPLLVDAATIGSKVLIRSG